MKRALVFATAISLLLPGLSMAQSNPQGPPGRQERPEQRPGAQHGAPGGRPGGPAGGPQHPAPPGRPVQAGPSRPMPGHPPVAGGPMPGRPVAQRPLPPRGNQFWHRGRYFARVRGPVYAYPRGWGYRRWDIGARLPAILYAPGFFYAGWAALGLQAPPPGYAWVRFGPDLLEVNLTTGEVDDVVYGVFY